MNVGIIGFARSGKTTVFNALTGSQAEVGSYGARDANLAVLKVPDERVDVLTEIYRPKKKTYAEFQFIDVPPSESGEDRKALDESALTSLRNAEALVHVVRAFGDEAVMHPLGSVDPERDCGALEEELQFADLVVIERRLERKDRERSFDAEYEALQRCKAHIEAGRPLRTLDLPLNQAALLTGFTFLSQKPILLLANYGEEGIGEEDPAGLRAYADKTGQALIELCGAMEMEVTQLPEEERQAFRDELGLGAESRTRFLRTAYSMLGLISFLTAGEPEVRAWTIRRGATAPEAAGTIHSDLQRGFIRAEVVSYEDFAECGSMAKVKERGLLRLEGKDYVVRDGDIMLIRFNV
jgi:hypothetical protein